MAAPETQPKSVDEAEKAAACALTALAGIGANSLEILREAHGSLARAAAVGGKALAKVPGLRSDGIESLQAAGDLEKRGVELLRKAKKLGAQVLLKGEDGYPALLADAPGSPALLYVLGRLGEGRRVAIVGSRRSDEYGIGHAEKLAEKLARAGVEVVSGGAEGVDKAAHEAVLKLSGRTIAVVGTGLLKAYPGVHGKLYDEIAKKGAVVSEFAIDAGGQRHQFPQRNRTIAGLSEAVVITRGKVGSGALSTCEAAVRFGRPVFAVPGRVDEAEAFAPNSVLASGDARAVVTGDEVVAALKLGRVQESRTAVPAGPVPKGLEKLYGVLGPAPRSVDDIALEAGLATNEALAELLKLELAGLCTARPGKYFARR